MHSVIKIDKKFPECTAIDTDAWLAAVLGEEVLTGGELEEHLSNHWLMRSEYQILEAIETAEGRNYRRTQVDNVYNNENDFSDVFQWQVFYPEESRSGDWFYADDVYVAIEPHMGGDPRGNYGRTRIYKVDCLADSGFLDWVLGWHVQYANGEEVVENDRFSIGYSSHPFYEMEQHLKSRPMWSAKRKCFVAVYQDGRAVELHPYTNTY